MALHSDPTGKTFLYIMYVDTITLSPEEAEVAQQPILCRWYVDQSNWCSEPVSLIPNEPVPANYYSFLVVTCEPNQRSKQVILSISPADAAEHLCVAFLDMANFSAIEEFKQEVVEVRNQAGVVATVVLHTASQGRWTRDAPVTPAPQAYFVDPAEDAQASHLYGAIVQAHEEEAAVEAVSQKNNEAEAEEARRKEALEQKELEEKRRREEEEKERDRKRHAEEERRRQEEEERQEEERKQRENEEAERRRRENEEEERRTKEEEARQDRERKEAAEREAREAREREAAEQRDAQRRREEQDLEWERDKEARRRGDEEEEDRRRNQRDRGGDGYDRNRGRDRDHNRDFRHTDDADRHHDLDRDRDRIIGRSDRDRRESDFDRDRAWQERDRDRYKDQRDYRDQRDRDNRGAGWDRDRERERERRRADLEAEERERARRDEEERREQQRARERRKWEEDRERLRQDAKRERQKEASERERRAQERRRQQDAAAARLATEAPRSGRDSPAGDARPETPASGRSSAAGVPAASSTRGRQEPAAETGARSSSQHQRRRFDDGHAEPVPVRHSPAHAMSTTGRTSRGSSNASAPQPASTRRGGAPAGRSNAGGQSVPPNDVASDSGGSDANPFEGDYDAPSGIGGTASSRRQQHGGGRNATMGGPARGAGDRRLASNSAAFAAAASSQVPMTVRLEQLKAISGQRAGLWTGDNIQEYLAFDTEVAAPVAQSVAGAGDGEILALADNGPQEVNRRGSKGFLAPPGHQDGVSQGAAGSANGRGSNAGGGAPRPGPKRSPRASPRTRTVEASVQTGLGGGSRVAAEVVAAALADAATGGCPRGIGNVGGGLGTAPVAAVEECVLRLLMLQRELGGGAAVPSLTPRGEDTDDFSRANLANAAAGLAPRMLQVLEAARAVCEANQVKMKTFCKERNIDFDKLGGGGQGYLQPQITALDRLKSQYASLQPASSAAPVMGAPCAGLHPQASMPQPLQPPAVAGCGELRTPRRQCGETESCAGMSPMPFGHAATASPQGSQLQQMQQMQQLQHQLQQQLRHQMPPEQHLSMPSPLESTSAGLCGNGEAYAPVRPPPLDPGASGPQLPVLRSGGSTPPPAKFRSRPQDDMQHAVWTALGASVAPAVSSGAPHPPPMPARRSDGMSAAMWGAVGDTIAAAPSPDSARSSSDRWAGSTGAVGGGSAATPQGSRGAGPLGTSPLRPSRSEATQVPLRAALEQCRGVAETIAPAAARRAASARQSAIASRQARGSARGNTGGGAHAAAGSPSPEGRHQEQERGSGPSLRAPLSWSRKGGVSAGQPAEDRYLKILQGLQAKGAAPGPAGMLEGVAGPTTSALGGNRARLPWRKAPVADTDSDSSSDKSGRRIPSRRPLSTDRGALTRAR